jgi:hypothetical protein
MIGRLTRCRNHLTRQDLIDRLCHAEMFCTMALADWTAYIGATAALRASPDRNSAGYGYLYLALVTGRHAPDEARSLIDRFVHLSGDDPTGDAHDEAIVWQSMVESMSGELATAADLAMKVRDRPAGRTSLGLNCSMIVGIAAWAEGRPEELAAVAQRLEDAHKPTGRTDPYFQSVTGFARALVSLSTDELDVARAAVRRGALDALSGRVALVDGDALGLLAELARREGDSDLARELIMNTGPGRSPAAIGALRFIAQQLGVDDELQEAYRENLLDMEWMTERPRAALRRELERRGWAAI